MKAIIMTVTKKYEHAADLLKIAGMLIFCIALCVVWVGILVNTGLGNY